MFHSAPGPDVKIKKISHVMYPDAVNEIANDAAEDQTQCCLAEQGMGVKMMAGPKKHDKRNHGDNGEQSVSAHEQAPSRARVTPMNKPEETVNDDLFVTLAQPSVNQQLGDLIQRHHQERDQRDADIGFPKRRGFVGLVHVCLVVHKSSDLRRRTGPQSSQSVARAQSDENAIQGKHVKTNA